MERKVIVIVEPNTPTKFCKSCGFPIVWGHTPTQNKPCPADIYQVDGQHYSHFETCQYASQHSKRRSGAEPATPNSAGAATAQETLPQQPRRRTFHHAQEPLPLPLAPGHPPASRPKHGPAAN